MRNKFQKGGQATLEFLIIFSIISTIFLISLAIYSSQSNILMKFTERNKKFKELMSFSLMSSFLELLDGNFTYYLNCDCNSINGILFSGDLSFPTTHSITKNGPFQKIVAQPFSVE
jgi:hypothetical protein